MSRIRNVVGTFAIPRPARLGWILLSATTLAIVTGMADARVVTRTPLPEFTGRKVTVMEVPDRYAEIVTKAEQVEKATGVPVYVTVIRSSGRGDNATRTYVDDLFRSWSKSSAGTAKFDPEKSVLVVVALENRQIAAHAGDEVRSRYGLDSRTIRSELIESKFIPAAKQEHYDAALMALLDGVQEKILGTQTQRDRGIVHPLPTDGLPTSKTAPRKTATNGSAGSQILWAVLASLAAVLAIILGLVWLGRRRVSDSVAKQIKGVKGEAVEAMDRLDALKERHKLLPATAPGFKGPMTGQTLELYNAVQAKLDSLWDRWLQVMEKIDKAQKLAESAGGLSLGNQKSRQAEEILRKEVKFPEIEAEAKACSADLDRLEKAHDEVQASIKSLIEARTKLKGQVEDVGKAGLPIEPYKPELDAIEGLGAQADATVAADPIGSEGIVEQAKARVEGQITRASDVLALFTQAKGVERALKEVERAAAAQRSNGFKLQEEAANPDTLVADGMRRNGLAMAALQAGDPTTAKTELAEADALAKKGQQVLDAVVQAKALCRREGPARDRETRRLGDAFVEAKNYRDELERDFAPASWQGVARNLDQAKALMNTFDRKAAEAAEEGSDTKQNYLLGARLFEELARQQQIALRLMAGLGEQVNTLVGIRKEVQELNRQLETADRKLASLFDQNGEIVGTEAQRLFESAHRAASGIARKINERRPDWPAIRDELRQLLEEYAIAENQAETDLNSYRSFVSEIDGVRREASRVEAYLASHSEDRLAANRRFESAANSLNEVSNVGGGGLDWPRLLQTVRDAASDLEASIRMAKEDIRLAAQAQSDIAEADAAIRQASTAVGMGIVANTSDAVARLRQAEQLLDSQNYEQAITQAESAFQSARSAYNSATRQIFLQQMQFEAARRRQYAADMSRASYRGPSAGSIAAGSAAAAILGRMAEAAGYSSGENPPPEQGMQVSQDSSDGANSDDGTAVGSWSTDSAPGDW